MTGADRAPAAPAADGQGPAWLTPRQVAALLQVSTKTVTRLVAADATLPVVRIGAQLRFSAARLARWLDARTSGPGRARKIGRPLPSGVQPIGLPGPAGGHSAGCANGCADGARISAGDDHAAADPSRTRGAAGSSVLGPPGHAGGRSRGRRQGAGPAGPAGGGADAVGGAGGSRA